MRPGEKMRVTRTRMVAVRRLALSGAVWLVVLGTGCPSGGLVGEPCRGPEDCNSGLLCVFSVCTKPCNSAADCSSKDERCENGLCIEVANAECSSDSQCTSPGPCQIAARAECSEGACRYQLDEPGAECLDGNPCTLDDLCNAAGQCVGTPKVCDAPPSPSCIEGDSVYRTYAPLASCLVESGLCDYRAIDVDCPGCQVNCLDVCAQVTCNEPNGGCRGNGVCVPGDPPECRYDIADDNIECDRPGDPPGSLTGYCYDGICRGCNIDSSCDDAPGDHPECFTGRCVEHVCQYFAIPDVVCVPTSCAEGFLYPQRLCGGEGLCSDGIRESCGGMRCDEPGSACLTACVEEEDCMPGAYCDVDGSCSGLLDDGEDCSTLGASACLSGYCDGSICCAGGDCCNQELDCDGYVQSSACADTSGATDCQGVRRDAVCTDHVCGYIEVEDDSGCAGLQHVCPGALRPVLCLASPVQESPVCATECAGDGDCLQGYMCDPEGNCVLRPGVGETCTGTGQGSCAAGLKCENAVCCEAGGPACCTGPEHCADGLACNSVAFTCLTTCNDYASEDCAEPGESYCFANTCQPKLPDAESCDDPGQCQRGHCVEGVCCEEVCADTCVSCLASRTGLASDGLCGPLLRGRTDDAPFPLCTATGGGCAAGNCACDGLGRGPTHCKAALQEDCSNAVECASAVCECADEQCGARMCVEEACAACAYATGGSSCYAGMGTSQVLEDPPQCSGDERSCYAGACLKDVGSQCFADDDCGSGNCECGDPICSAGGKRCAQVACGACEYTSDGLGCEGDLDSSIACNDGSACTRTDTCQGGQCVGSNPIVCDSAQGCQNPVGICDPADGSCDFTLRSAGYICRVSVGACDAEELCDGVNMACPGDAKSTSVCRPAAGACDLAEVCNGIANDCPQDLKSTDQCRGAAGPCDDVEYCTGSSNDCPFDAKKSSLCRSAAGGCDEAEYCDGVADSCPADAKRTGECRAAGGVCDLAEQCDGFGDHCPADVLRITVCRTAAGVCDAAESCNGTDVDCPVDRKSTASCRSPQGICDAEEFCDGASDTCPADGKLTSECRPVAGVCDLSEFCSGASNDCPADVVQNGTTCRGAAGACDLIEYCSGGSAHCPSDLKSTAECRASTGACDPAELCDGAGNNCPADQKAGSGDDCGVCRRCNATGDCLPNSTDHSDCLLCQKCQTGACVDQAPGEDLRTPGDCPSYNCTEFIYGWVPATGTACHAFLENTAINGGCDGTGQCTSPTNQACSGVGVLSSSCGDVGCKRACPTGGLRTDFNVRSEVCYTDGLRHDCPNEYFCDANANCMDSGTCPFLFVWNGQEFDFETDLNGPGKLATRTAGGYLKPNPHDYYVIDTLPEPVAGGIELRLVEERHEADYLDLMQLYAVDVPDDRLVYGEKPAFEQPHNGFDPPLHTVAVMPTPPQAARHVNTGEDVLGILTSSGNYLELNEDRNDGFEYQTVELELGDVGDAPQIKLIIDGRTQFPTTPEGVARSWLFGPRTRLEVPDGNGGWVRVPTELVDLPRPPEFRRVFVLDISTIFVAADYRVRLTFLFRTLLDTIFLDTTEDLLLNLVPLPVQAAELRLHGYDDRTGGELYEYIYDQLLPYTPAPFPGAYTRYGDVLPLLSTIDDLFAIYFGGDELVLTFAAPPPPAPGHHTAFMTYTVAYYKDIKVDVPHTVEPLPFAAMSNFPYDDEVEHYPDDFIHNLYRRTYNTRRYP